MITAAVFVDSSDGKVVKCPTVQIRDITGRGGSSAGRVVTSDPLSQHEVAEGSV